MIVVSDTSPITALLTVGRVNYSHGFLAKWSFLQLWSRNSGGHIRFYPAGCGFNRCGTTQKPHFTRRVWTVARPRRSRWLKNFTLIIC